MTECRKAISLHFSDMIKINEVLVVEGKYDKIKLSRLFDTLIVTTDGFRIYKNKEKAQMLKALAKKRGIILLTDSDKAGFRIRNKIREIVGDADIKNVYIPQIEGKEKRKEKKGAEGLLGVEGIPDEILVNAVMLQAKPRDNNDKITNSEMFELGFSGGENSSELRKQLCVILNLPKNMSAKALLDTINILCTRQEFYELIEKNFHIEV